MPTPTVKFGAIWACLSFKRGDKSDELIIQITHTPSWWARNWCKEPTTINKMVFVGREFEWARTPNYEFVNDEITKYRLRDLWYEQHRKTEKQLKPD